MTPRRRALLLGGLALLLGGLAASDVASREAALDRQLGPLVPVVVTRAPVAAGDELARTALTVRSVPSRFAPRGAFTAPTQVVGRRAGASLPAGTDVTAAALASAEPAGPGAPVRAGERIAEIVAAGSPELVVPGARVDVLVTREGGPGQEGRTELALQDVEVLAAAAATTAGADGTAAATARVSASLRVTLRQAVFLTAAQSFARELRLLPRAPGDRRRSGAVRDVG